MNLNELKPGQSGVIETVGGEGALRQHFLDMGVIPGTEVSVIKLAPLGDPMELQIHGYELTLRLADAEKIGIVPVSRQEGKEEKQAQRSPEHPGLGEEGRFHPKGSEATRACLCSVKCNCSSSSSVLRRMSWSFMP